MPFRVGDRVIVKELYHDDDNKYVTTPFEGTIAIKSQILNAWLVNTPITTRGQSTGEIIGVYATLIVPYPMVCPFT
jgi:hypothetical protein